MKTTEYKDYCDNLTFELAGWKEKIDHIVYQFDRASTGEKEGVVGEVNGLHIISDEMSERLRGLCSACDTNWEAQMEDHDVVWPVKFETNYGELAQSDFGG